MTKKIAFIELEDTENERLRIFIVLKQKDNLATYRPYMKIKHLICDNNTCHPRRIRDSSFLIFLNVDIPTCCIKGFLETPDAAYSILRQPSDIKPTGLGLFFLSELYKEPFTSVPVTKDQ